MSLNIELCDFIKEQNGLSKELKNIAQRKLVQYSKHALICSTIQTNLIAVRGT